MISKLTPAVDVLGSLSCAQGLRPYVSIGKPSKTLKSDWKQHVRSTHMKSFFPPLQCVFSIVRSPTRLRAHAQAMPMPRVSVPTCSPTQVFI